MKLSHHSCLALPRVLLCCFDGIVSLHWGMPCLFYKLFSACQIGMPLQLYDSVAECSFRIRFVKLKSQLDANCLGYVLPYCRLNRSHFIPFIVRQVFGFLMKNSITVGLFYFNFKLTACLFGFKVMIFCFSHALQFFPFFEFLGGWFPV